MAGYPRAGLTKAQAVMLQAIKDLTLDGVSPSYDELAARTGLKGRGPVAAQLNRLRDKGRITWDPGRARSIQVLADPVTGNEADLSPTRLRGVIEDAADALATEIGQAETTAILRKVMEKHRARARRERRERLG